MEKIFNESKFLIILHSDDEYNISEQWKEQCENLYNDLYRALPEGYIEPSTQEVSEGERPFDIISFSILIISEVAAKCFASIIFEALKNWSENNHAYIKVKCPDGSIIKIPKQTLSELTEFSIENPKLSICEALKRIIDSNE